MTNNYLSEYVHYNISEGRPHNYLSEYVHKYILESCPQTNKYLCFENDLSYMASCIYEGVSEDSRHGTGHVDIQGGICIILLECVWLPMHENPCRKIQLLGIAHPVMGITISGDRGTTGDKAHPRPQL